MATGPLLCAVLQGVRGGGVLPARALTVVVVQAGQPGHSPATSADCQSALLHSNVWLAVPFACSAVLRCTVQWVLRLLWLSWACDCPAVAVAVLLWLSWACDCPGPVIESRGPMGERLALLEEEEEEGGSALRADACPLRDADAALSPRITKPR